MQPRATGRGRARRRKRCGRPLLRAAAHRLLPVPPRMNIQSTVSAFSRLALASALVVGCGAAPEEFSDGSADADLQTLDEELISIGGGSTSTGFICTGFSASLTCTCDPSSDSPIDGCAGMSDLCD